MTAAPDFGPRKANPPRQGGVILGDDWIADESEGEGAAPVRRRSSIMALKNSPLARKIIVFNMIALVILMAGVLFLNPFRDSLVAQREQAYVTEARMIARIVELAAQQGDQGGNLVQAGDVLADLDISAGASVALIDPAMVEVAVQTGPPVTGFSTGRPTFISDFLGRLWETVSAPVAAIVQSGPDTAPAPNKDLARAGVDAALQGQLATKLATGPNGGAVFTIAAPVMKGGTVAGVVTLVSPEGEVDALVRNEREQILQMFLLALVISAVLSLVLASTIANPIADLAAAAEAGPDRDGAKVNNGRVRIPDLTARPDEIGRLSVALRGMVAALYDRIDANEQFAADVAHEIKNPLASLSSAVSSLRVAQKDEQRSKLLDVIDHDVRRLDRLVSDISNASRLDSELVKEQETDVNLTRTLTNLCEYLGGQAKDKGVELITDFPEDPIKVRGLEARLAQVFVNLATNAISFCEDGDAVRIWARRRDNRVLVVVEDTGPGIPEEALTKIFNRFYSERPKDDFGNNSGLGLSISKQIVEAHGGVIWAENIQPTDADPNSEPLGARFVVGLPV